MKRTQIKDALRNIWKQRISYLSIVVIAMLGVTMFLGIDYSSAALKDNSSIFYNEVNYRDVEAISTMLLSEDDLDLIRVIDGVTDVEGVFSTSAKATSADRRQDVTVISKTERINLPILLEGRLPEQADECAVEQRVAEAMGWHIGDSVLIGGAKSAVADYLKDNRYTLTGLIIHPDHICGSVPDTLYVMVTRETFDTETLDNCYMRAEIKIKGLSAHFTDAYRSTLGVLYERIERLAGERTAIREAEFRSSAERKVDDGRKALDDAKRELDEAREKLDDGYEQLKEGERQYKEAEQRLRETREKLDDAKRVLKESVPKLEEARGKLDAAKEELEARGVELSEAKAKLDGAKRKLVAGWDQIEEVKQIFLDYLKQKIESVIGKEAAEEIRWATLRRIDPDQEGIDIYQLPITEDFTIHLEDTLEDTITEVVASLAFPDAVLEAAFEKLGGEGEYDETTARELLTAYLQDGASPYEEDYAQLIGALQQWDAGYRQYRRGLKQYLHGYSLYREGQEQYRQGEKEYEEGLEQYETGVDEYEKGEQQYTEGVDELKEARDRLDDSSKKLGDGEKEYADGLERYLDGEAGLQDAIDRLEAIGSCKWILTDGYGNASFLQLNASSENLRSMEMTFSLLFVLVGALVIYATISKMIDEQRPLVGTTKALGFYKREIYLKYLTFGVSATLLGAFLGLLLARFFVEGFILRGYNLYYSINLKRPTIVLLPTLAMFAAAILLAVAASYFACARLVRTPAVRLMQQAVPEGRKKTATGKKHVLSLYSRLILLNMRTDLKRVIVTIVSVAGCCSLVVIGFTLRSAVKGTVQRQFTDIVQYDALVLYDAYANEAAGEQIGGILTDAGAETVPVQRSYITVNLAERQLQELYVGDPERIGELYRILDPKTGEPLSLEEDGMLVSLRFSETTGVKTGDTVEIALNGIETAHVRVTGVFNNYMNRIAIMSDACFRSAFGRDSARNGYLVRLNGADAEALQEEMKTVSGYEAYRVSDEFRSLFKAATSVMDAVVVLFIFMAAIMAGVVLMNLTNIYFMQKKREMTIMRVNGFTVKEVLGYVLRETIVTTVVGIVLGIALGAVLGYSIVRALEQPNLQLDRSVSLIAWLIGAAITVVFAVVVNVIVLRKVKDLKLTDVA